LGEASVRLQISITLPTVVERLGIRLINLVMAFLLAAPSTSITQSA